MTLSYLKAVVRLARLALAVLLAALLTACDGPRPDWIDRLGWFGTRSPEPEATAIRLELMAPSHAPDQERRLQEMVDAFQAGNPQVQVTLELTPDFPLRLQRRLEEGNPPDVFLVDSFHFPEMTDSGALAPADGHLDSPNDFYPILREAFTRDGVLYCPPRDFTTLALQYSPARFAEADLVPPATWEELRAAAESLTNPGRSLYGLALPPDFSRWLPTLYQAGGTLFDTRTGDLAINSPAALSALAFYTDLAADGVAFRLSDLGSSWAGEALGKRQVAMALEGNWIVPYLAEEFPDMEYAVAELPAGPGGRATVAFTSCYAVAAAGLHQEAAFRLVNALTNAEGTRAWTALGVTVPGRVSLRGEWLARFPSMAPFLNGIDYAHVWQFPPGFDPVIQAVNRGIQQVFNGDATPEDVLADVEEQGRTLRRKE